MLVKHKVTGQIRDIAERQLNEYEAKGYSPLPSVPPAKKEKQGNKKGA